MSTDKTPKRTAGRPRGSQTKNDPIVTEHPPACPRCGSHNRTPKAHLQTHYVDHAGDGFYYRTTWSRVTCNDCGQHYRVKRTTASRQPFGPFEAE